MTLNDFTVQHVLPAFSTYAGNSIFMKAGERQGVTAVIMHAPIRIFTGNLINRTHD
jgi:hypothetical protein